MTRRVVSHVGAAGSTGSGRRAGGVHAATGTAGCPGPSARLGLAVLHTAWLGLGPVAAFVAHRLPQTSSQQVLDTDDLMLRS